MSKSDVVATTPFGGNFKESFIGIVCWPEDLQIDVHFACGYYPKTHELKDYFDKLHTEHGDSIPADKLKDFVENFAAATVDPKDTKRFYMYNKSNPSDVLDCARHRFSAKPPHSASTLYGSMSPSAMHVSSIFYFNLHLTNPKPFRDYDTCITTIQQMIATRSIRYPIKFVVELDPEKTGIGWVD